MSDPQSPQSQPVNIRRRIGIALGCVVLLMVILGIIASQREYARSAGALQTLMARLDEEDPNWRLADIEANREEIPEDENSARVIVTVAGGLPKEWGMKLAEVMPRPVPPDEMLDAATVDVLQKEMAEAAGVLPQARRLMDMPRGRFRITYTLLAMGTLLPELQSAREVNRLLNYDAVLLAQQGDINGALRSARAAINAARATGDEPFLVSCMTRSAGVAQACIAIERALAQGQASEKELLAVQRLLELEDKHPTLWYAARGERAAHYDTIEKAITGQLNARHMRRSFAERELTMWESWLVSPTPTRREQAESLALLTRVVECTRLPDDKRLIEEGNLEAEMHGRRSQISLPGMILPHLAKVNEHARRKSLHVRSLLAAVAAERFRMATGKWPDTLEQLKAKFLAEVPLDPFDGKPLRFARQPDGVVIYSLGLDGVDDGGRILPRRAADEGHRLWDVDKRRQPARPSKP